MNKQTPSSPARRSFLTSRTAGVTSIAALAVGGAALVQGKPKAAARWEPAHHDQDSWMDVPSKHRLVFDTTTAHGFGEGVLYAGNYLLANRDAYKMEDKDLAILIIARHASTPFAYNDAMWEKYGTAMRPLTQFDDPKTKAPPKKNVFNSADYGTQLPNFGTTIDALVKQGVRFGVCAMATRAIASLIAKASSGNADAINTELTSNLVSNARMVPAGIVGVSRAQEWGYTLVSA